MEAAREKHITYMETTIGELTWISLQKSQRIEDNGKISMKCWKTCKLEIIYPAKITFRNRERGREGERERKSKGGRERGREREKKLSDDWKTKITGCQQACSKRNAKGCT